jgi:hypothetical protein
MGDLKGLLFGNINSDGEIEGDLGGELNKAFSDLSGGDLKRLGIDFGVMMTSKNADDDDDEDYDGEEVKPDEDAVDYEDEDEMIDDETERRRTRAPTFVEPTVASEFFNMGVSDEDDDEDEDYDAEDEDEDEEPEAMVVERQPPVPDAILAPLVPDFPTEAPRTYEPPFKVEPRKTRVVRRTKLDTPPSEPRALVRLSSNLFFLKHPDIPISIFSKQKLTFSTEPR